MSSGPTMCPSASTPFCPPIYMVVAPGGTTATWLKAGLRTSPSGRKRCIESIIQDATGLRRASSPAALTRLKEILRFANANSGAIRFARKKSLKRVKY